MGIPMDIHTPSAISSTSAPQPGSSSGNTRDNVLELIKQKDVVEAELKALGGVLDSHGVKMTTSLTTFDGFPRDDIDVAQIRITRTRIICLRNDYKALMNRIETALHEHHAFLASNPTSPPDPTTTTTTTPSASESILTPFAKVNTISPNSPASTAGLIVGDHIKRFGPINAVNNERLAKVAEVVGTSEGKEIVVLISRRDEEGLEVDMSLRLTPRSGWGGRGLLGCHLLPL